MTVRQEQERRTNEAFRKASKGMKGNPTDAQIERERTSAAFKRAVSAGKSKGHAAAVGVSGRTLSKSKGVTTPAPAPREAHMFTLRADPNAPCTFKAAMAEAEKTGVLRVPFKALCGPGRGTTVQLVKNDRKDKRI